MSPSGLNQGPWVKAQSFIEHNPSSFFFEIVFLRGWFHHPYKNTTHTAFAQPSMSNCRSIPTAG